MDMNVSNVGNQQGPQANKAPALQLKFLDGDEAGVWITDSESLKSRLPQLTYDLLLKKETSFELALAALLTKGNKYGFAVTRPITLVEIAFPSTVDPSKFQDNVHYVDSTVGGSPLKMDTGGSPMSSSPNPQDGFSVQSRSPSSISSSSSLSGFNYPGIDHNLYRKALQWQPQHKAHPGALRAHREILIPTNPNVS